MYTRTCTWPGCDRRHDSRGYCVNHAQYAIRHGLIDLVQPKGRTTDERFDSTGWDVDASGCWVWRGGKRHNGYGNFYVGGHQIGAHRYAYQRRHGAIPPGNVVMHRCDNPPCVNPDHLIAGTTQQNIDDMIRKGRANQAGLALGRGGAKGTHLPTYRNPAAHLTASDVREFRRRYDAGESQVSLRASFGLSKRQAYRIAHRHAWKNIP